MRERTIIGKAKVKETSNGDIILGFICIECLQELSEKHGTKGTDKKTYVKVFIKKFKSGEADKYGNTHTIDINIE